MQLRVEAAKQQIHEVPLDSLVADSQGAIGYMIQRDLREELERRGLRAGNGSTAVTASGSTVSAIATSGARISDGPRSSSPT